MLTQYVNGKFVFLQLIFFSYVYCYWNKETKKKNIEILYFSLKKKKGKSNETRKSLFLKFTRKSIIYATDAHLNSTIDVNHSAHHKENLIKIYLSI